MKKIRLTTVIFCFFIFIVAQTGHAITVGFDSTNYSALLGEQINLDILISGLGDGSDPSLSIFDITLSFNPDDILLYNDIAYGDELDLFSTGSLIETNTEPGFVSIFEMSFDFAWDLDSLQSDDFILASISFDTIQVGSGVFDLSINDLGDAWGNSLVAEVNSAGFEISDPGSTPIPEPSTYLLLGLGCILMGFVRKKFRG